MADYERLEPESVSLVPAPKGTPQREFYDLDWSAAQKSLVVSIGSAVPGEANAYLATLKLDGSAPRRLSVPPEKGCEITEPFAPRVLRDGRIVHWSLCLGATTRADRNLRTLRVYDPDRSTAGRYVQRFFRLFEGGWFDFSSRSDAGVLSLGDQLSNKLYRLDPTGLERFDVPLHNVGDVRWAPNGRQVAVAGVPTEAGPDSPTRQNVPWSVFLVGSGEPREIVSGLEDGVALDWSPDGRWLVLSTKVRGAASGLWLFRLATNELFLLREGDAFNGPPRWLPDSRIVVPVGGAPDLGYRGRHGLEVLRVRLPA